MTIAGLMRVRNESLLIKETLDHLSRVVDSIYVLDDHSTDNTVEICKNHPKVRNTIEENKYSGPHMPTNEGIHRQRLVDCARKDAKYDWFIYIDADERFDDEFIRDIHQLTEQTDYDAICLMLYDFYITDTDKNLVYNGNLSELRPYCGTEYRNTLILYRNISSFHYPYGMTTREPVGFKENRVFYSNYKIKHYGKAISIEEWERKVDWYIQHYPRYRDKWKNRKGKAIHTVSDFDTPLVTWDEIKNNHTLKHLCIYSYSPSPNNPNMLFFLKYIYAFRNFASRILRSIRYHNN